MKTGMCFHPQFNRGFRQLSVVNEKSATLERVTRHDAGSALTFPGEFLGKTAPFKPEDYPVLPEAFHGFYAAVSEKIVRTSTELMEVVIEVHRLLEVWKGNATKKPENIVGKRVMLGGCWHRKASYHGLKTGDEIEVGMKHTGCESKHPDLTSFIREAKLCSNAPREHSEAEFAAPGVIGALVGRLVEKDVEKGT